MHRSTWRTPGLSSRRSQSRCTAWRFPSFGTSTATRRSLSRTGRSWVLRRASPLARTGSTEALALAWTRWTWAPRPCSLAPVRPPTPCSSAQLSVAPSWPAASSRPPRSWSPAVLTWTSAGSTSLRPRRPPRPALPASARPSGPVWPAQTPRSSRTRTNSCSAMSSTPAFLTGASRETRLCLPTRARHTWTSCGSLFKRRRRFASSGQSTSSAETSLLVLLANCSPRPGRTLSAPRRRACRWSRPRSPTSKSRG
mmetsp:Transcript_27443/g.63952  ORF Transcript_27443/g.63952 Transcript_27443/m.63952 type:complete len:254 (+) Transcript_27443:1064-1825(+)